MLSSWSLPEIRYRPFGHPETQYCLVFLQTTRQQPISADTVKVVYLVHVLAIQISGGSYEIELLIYATLADNPVNYFQIFNIENNVLIFGHMGSLFRYTLPIKIYYQIANIILIILESLEEDIEHTCSLLVLDIE